MKRADRAELEAGLQDLLGLVQDGSLPNHDIPPHLGAPVTASSAPAEPVPPTPLLESIDALQGLLEERQNSR